MKDTRQYVQFHIAADYLAGKWKILLKVSNLPPSDQRRLQSDQRD